MAEGESLLIDGTFRTTPGLWTQVHADIFYLCKFKCKYIEKILIIRLPTQTLIIHAEMDTGMYVPVAYAYLPVVLFSYVY